MVLLVLTTMKETFINTVFNKCGMKKFLILLIASSSILFASCASSKFYSGEASDIKPIALVRPYSYITDAVDDWATKYLDDVSKINEDIITKNVTAASVILDETIPMNYDKTASSSLNSWMRNLSNVSSAENLIVPQEIRDAVKKSGNRYAMVITDVGYLKNPKQYAAEQAIETGARILGAILTGEVDLSSNTEECLNGVFALVFDNETGKVVWFGAQPRRYKKNPVDPKTMNEQLGKLLKPFK